MREKIVEKKKPEKIDPLPETIGVKPAARSRTGKHNTTLTARSTAELETFPGPKKPFVC